MSRSMKMFVLLAGTALVAATAAGCGRSDVPDAFPARELTELAGELDAIHADEMAEFPQARPTTPATRR